MPRAAIVSLHARVEKTSPVVLQDSSLVQVWGPRYQAYVVARADVACFTLGRMPDGAAGRRRAHDLAARLHDVLGDREMPYGQAAKTMGVPANALRYAATTGTLLLRWDGAKQPTIRTVPAPADEPFEARMALAKRYLHIFGPATADDFAAWAGITHKQASAAFDALGSALSSIRTPIGDARLLADDVPVLRAARAAERPPRLLPSGDTYFLLKGGQRELLLPDAERRQRLWTSRVWPGAILVNGEILGTWRRAQHVLTIQPWRRLSRHDRSSLEREALALPLPGLDEPLDVRWEAGT